jgi:hypothetical protein
VSTEEIVEIVRNGCQQSRNLLMNLQHHKTLVRAFFFFSKLNAALPSFLPQGFYVAPYESIVNGIEKGLRKALRSIRTSLFSCTFGR